MSLVDRYRDWFEYEMDCHRKTLAAIDSVPPSGRTEDYQSCLDLFAHLMICRRLWLYRSGNAESGPTTIEEIFPTATERAELDERLQSMADDWRPYLDQLDHAELGRRFDYSTTEGDRFTNSVEEILTQLFGHAWHHRGQIMALVRRCGGEPVACDYVYSTRTAVTADGA
jgi:uncharacterized damage-inducible protein DinB